jgi:hypothetical protein
MQALQPLLNSLAFNVFLGTLPLLGMIFWGLFQNDKRLQDVKDLIKSESSRVEGVLGAKLDGLDARVKALESRPPLVTR